MISQPSSSPWSIGSQIGINQSKSIYEYFSIHIDAILNIHYNTIHDPCFRSFPEHKLRGKNLPDYNGLDALPDCTELISRPLSNQRTIVSSPSRERPVRQGVLMLIISIKSRF